MKLSEAIRLGSMLGPQVFFFLGFEHDESSCAQGAALRAVGRLWFGQDKGEPGSFALRAFAELWPQSMEVGMHECPVCHRVGGPGPWAGMLPHLNNDHEWTRERIADWVEHIENKQAQRTAPEPALAALRRG